jgi:uncharacterized iron-regulated protein
MNCLAEHPPVVPTSRRRLLIGAAAAAVGSAGCALIRADRVDAAWTARLQGDTVALLGEVHDNPLLHRLRADALRRACADGWRPAVVMEQFDTDRQADLDRARRERPRDVHHLVEQASGERSGWTWPDYEPVLALVLERELPLYAGNLSRAQAARIVRDGYDAAFSPSQRREIGLDALPDRDWQRLQEREIDDGHCGKLPAHLLPAMARAQFARDAVMAQVLARQGTRGAVLLAGNGHVRRDIGVPRWLGSGLPAHRLLAVGYLETPQPADRERYDAVVVAAAPSRPDPCAAFERR